MTTLTLTSIPTILGVSISADTLSVELSDGRTISAPIAWYPRLQHGTDDERARHEIIGDGHGIHWPDLDEDISAENLVLGQPSGESQTAFGKWLASRQA
jgi:Protein of unknown function (DUF2442)